VRTEPLITIGIPNYNYGRYLRQCLNSAIDQPGEDIEILVADNSSSDNSWSIVTEYKDRRLRIWRHHTNIGLYPNWNFLLSQARGKFFKLLQSDDWLEPDFAAKMRQCLDAKSESKIAILLLGYHTLDERMKAGRTLMPPILPKMQGISDAFKPLEEFDSAILSMGYSMPTLNVLDTSLALEAGGYKPEDAMRSDGILFARILALASTLQVVSCNYPVVGTRIHSENDRWKYSRFAAFRDEVVYYSELIPLACKESRGPVLNQLISRAAGQALASLLPDLVRRRRIAEFFINSRWLLNSGVLKQAITTAPGEAIRSLRTKVCSKRHLA
jgi:glycosyltransferase involved in cell wall biosynthesis